MKDGAGFKNSLGDFVSLSEVTFEDHDCWWEVLLPDPAYGWFPHQDRSFSQMCAHRSSKINSATSVNVTNIYPRPFVTSKVAGPFTMESCVTTATLLVSSMAPPSTRGMWLASVSTCARYSFSLSVLGSPQFQQERQTLGSSL